MGLLLDLHLSPVYPDERVCVYTTLSTCDLQLLPHWVRTLHTGGPIAYSRFEQGEQDQPLYTENYFYEACRVHPALGLTGQGTLRLMVIGERQPVLLTEFAGADARLYTYYMERHYYTANRWINYSRYDLSKKNAWVFCDPDK